MNFINSVFRKFSYRETGESKDEGEGGLKSSRFYYRPAFVLFALNASQRRILSSRVHSCQSGIFNRAWRHKVESGRRGIDLRRNTRNDI